MDPDQPQHIQPGPRRPAANRWWCLVLVCLGLLLPACRADGPGRKAFAEAERAFADGRFVDAELAFQDFLTSGEEQPLRWAAWRRLLFIAERIRRDPTRTLDLLQTMALEFEDNPARTLEILERKATLHHEMGQYEQAVQSWQRGLEMSGADDQRRRRFLWSAAADELALGRLGQARDHLQACLALDQEPEFQAKVMYLLARSYNLAEDQDQALVWLERVMGLTGYQGEYRPMAVFLAADIRALKGDVEAARALLLSIQDTHPNPGLVKLRLEQLSRAKPTANTRKTP